MTNEARYLLDTHAWFWLVTGDTRVRPDLVEAIETAATHDRVYVSQISMWEIALKESIGKLQINLPITRWLHESSEGLQILDLPIEVIVDSSHLPGDFHKDPADRFIIATARHHRLTLVTGDRAILDYSEGGFVRVLPI